MIDAKYAQDVFKDAGENVSFVTLELNRKNQLEEKRVIQEFAERYPAILRSMRIRFDDHLKVAVGFSYQAWTYLFPEASIPKELETFEGIYTDTIEIPTTKGDIFIHIRANHTNVVYETQKQFTQILRSISYVIDETKGFRYFEGRSILGFVDGTEVPTGYEALQSSLIDSYDDIEFVNGSYAFAQKWKHDMNQWESLKISTQERAIGRNKEDDMELQENDKMSNAHNVAAHLEENGIEQKIIRMNVPYSNPAQEDTGTFFIGYARHWTTIKKMLEQMVHKDDFLFSFSQILSGQVYFIPSFDTLSDIADGNF